jgi:hypothetical protein
MKKSKSFRNHKNKLIFRGGSSKLSFASFVHEGSSIMGGSSNIGGSSNVSGALLAIIHLHLTRHDKLPRTSLLNSQCILLFKRLILN